MSREIQLYVMIGAPGSGKSTYARKRFEPHLIVSRDAIRFSLLRPEDDYFAREDEVYQRFIERIVEVAECEKECVVDATHLNRNSRNKLTTALDKTSLRGRYEIIYIVLDPGLDVVLERNAKREGRERVPDDVVARMYRSMTFPRSREHPAYRGIWVIQANGERVFQH